MCNLIRNDLLSKDVIRNKSSLVLPPIFKRNVYNFLILSLFFYLRTRCNAHWKFVLITDLTHLFNVFISLLYMFRATQCSSSGESIVSINNLVYITPCRWPFGIQVREDLSDLHTRRPRTRNDIYQTATYTEWYIPDGQLHGVIYTRRPPTRSNIYQTATYTEWYIPDGHLQGVIYTRRPPTRSDIYQTATYTE
jgi:hypothetical protein